MNVEIGTEAAQFPEKEYINGIFVAVHGVGWGNVVRVQVFEFGQCTLHTNFLSTYNVGRKQPPLEVATTPLEVATKKIFS
jgi:glucose/arabinose dehydrogenase